MKSSFISFYCVKTSRFLWRLHKWAQFCCKQEAHFGVNMKAKAGWTPEVGWLIQGSFFFFINKTASNTRGNNGREVQLYGSPSTSINLRMWHGGRLTATGRDAAAERRSWWTPPMPAAWRHLGTSTYRFSWYWMAEINNSLTLGQDFWILFWSIKEQMKQSGKRLMWREYTKIHHNNQLLYIWKLSQ